MNLCNSVPFWTPVADIRHQHLIFIQYCPILSTKVRFQTLVFDFRHQCPILDTCVRLQSPDPKLNTSTLLETTVSQQTNDRNHAGDHKFFLADFTPSLNHHLLNFSSDYLFCDDHYHDHICVKVKHLVYSSDEVIIDFSFESKWLTEWCEFFKTNQSLRRRKTNKISDDFRYSVADPQCS